MNRTLKFLLLATFWMSSQQLFAQDAEMADAMRSEGKIYVVVAIILTIFAGLILLLVRMDRKLQRLEKQIDKKG